MLHIFTHIPKTGGTSFKHSVIFPNIEISRIYRYHGLRAFAADRLNKYAVVIGHSPYGLHMLTRQKCTYYTILRNPIDRAISHYFYVLQLDLPDYKHPQLSIAKRLGLTGFTRFHANLQTRTIAGLPWNSLLKLSEPSLLRMAKNNLVEKFSCFSVLERIDSFQDRVAAMNGWTNMSVVNQTTKTLNRPKAETIDPNDMAELEEILKYDIELYEFARAHPKRA